MASTLLQRSAHLADRNSIGQLSYVKAIIMLPSVVSML
jgi:hypothetical protein